VCVCVCVSVRERDWSEWGPCSLTCGTGVRRRDRPPCRYNAYLPDCTVDYETEQEQPCRLPDCPREYIYLQSTATAEFGSVYCTCRIGGSQPKGIPSGGVISVLQLKIGTKDLHSQAVVILIF